MAVISRKEIDAFDKRYRVNFINSLPGFKSTNLCGTIDKNGNSNLAIINSAIHVGASPPLMGILFRPANVPRHSLENILAVNQYTLNHVTQEIYRAAHQTAAKYPEEVSEFEAVGLTAEFSEQLKAPYAKEASIKVGLELREKITLKSNQTIFLVGEILEVILPDDILLEDGFVDLQSAGSLTSSGLDAYYSTKKLSRLSYARPNMPLEDLDLF